MSKPKKTNNTQKNSKCKLWGDRNGRVNHTISEFSKMTLREYKSRHDWVEKVIHWELCKRQKFGNDDTKPNLSKKKGTHKILRDFEILTEHQIFIRKPDRVLINKKKKTCQLVDFSVPVDYWMKLKEKSESCQRAGKLWNMNDVVGDLGTVHKGLQKRLLELEIRERIKTIQTTGLLKSVRRHIKVLKTWGDLLQLRL